jgi:hypothetical protein
MATPPPPAASANSLIPSGLPCHCPRCAKAFSLYANYSTRTARIGRQLHRLAIFGGPIGLILVAILSGLFQRHSFDLGRSMGFGMIIGILGPAFFFEGLALLWPKVRTLRCHACGWEQDFPWVKSPHPNQKKSGP